MAFKTMKDYNEEKFGGLFQLRNDKDYADVIFLYRDETDVLVADTHYIKSSEYSGYVHCCGRGCPACAKGIRIQTKLFIPVYNINDKEIQFWDRTMRFEGQLNHDVFFNYPNPCQYVFRITRNGVPHDVNTTYSIQAVGKNTYKSYEQILEEFNTSFPKHYEEICKDLSIGELQSLLATPQKEGVAYGDMPNYQVVPRGATVQGSEQVKRPASNASNIDIDPDEPPFEFGGEDNEFESVPDELGDADF